MSTDHLTYDGEARTIMHCHDCGKEFVALLDYSIAGNHVVECPHCGHEHCRVIEGGKITEDRWSTRHGTDKDRDGIRARRVWKSNVLPACTSSTSEFLRNRWIDRFCQ